MTVHKKLKAARLLLNMKQHEAATASGLTQEQISFLETGKKVFIPTEYISWLVNKGIDINSLYNEEEVHFKNDAAINPNNPFNNDILRKNIVDIVNERLAEEMERLQEILYTMLGDVKAKELTSKLNDKMKTNLSKVEPHE